MPRHLHRRLLSAFVLVLVAGGIAVSLVHGQMQVRPVADEEGHAGLGLVLRKLTTVGSFMMATAHPDDENNALLALLSHGRGIRTALVSATRGDGGQNEIGAELFDALAVLRTEELLAAHRFDGAEQYFTRAVDFGYSFSVEETFERWGRQEILGDFVRMIRTLRPDVITGLRPTGGGGQHHQASAILAQEAFRAAADPTQFPEQIADGLRPWQAKKFYFSAGFGFRGAPAGADTEGLETIDLSGFDPLLGRTYADIGSEARSMHKCQGMPQVLRLPGDSRARYTLADTTIANRNGGDDAPLFDGIDTSLASLIQYAGARAPRGLAVVLTSIAQQAREAQRQFSQSGIDATRQPLLNGLAAVRNLRGQLRTFGLSDDAVYEIDFRLAQKEEQFQRAVMLAHGVRLEALADDGVVTAGQPVRVSALVANRGAADVAVRRVSFEGFDGAALGCGADVVTAGGVYTCDSYLSVPAAAAQTTPYFSRLPDAARYRFDAAATFGLPFEPSPFQATFAIGFSREQVSVRVPIQFRYEKEIFSGEKRTELNVVPRLAVQLSPEIAVAPVRSEAPRELRVIVSNRGADPTRADVALDVPAGWQVEPAEASIAFAREDEERTVRFFVTPAAGVAVGDHTVTARVTSDGARFEQGYQVVEYPHTQPRHLTTTAEARIKVIDVLVASDVLVGYVMGAGDQMPTAIEQLGGRVERLSGDVLAWGDLSKYDLIITGVRAYELDADLRAHNDRLMSYVEDGGTVIVQYNKFGFNDAQYGPFPAQVSRSRITDEGAPVELLVPNHPLFNEPNPIDATVWDGWVQERGLYFLGERAPQYVDLVSMEDPFENNPGVKDGALVEARVGQGRWLYVALGLWRQLPAGTEGAYRLLANLLSVADAP
ncbi:MAG: PIG-L family deacetylase [Vicinamibacterales bacterium]|nr:PIG-L family deacetylase [Vicinamibacterales bacterium]